MQQLEGRTDRTAILLNIEQELRKRKRYRLPLPKYIPELSPRYTEPKHLAAITDIFLSLTRGAQGLRVGVHAPPRHGKTETIAHAIPWLMESRPGIRIGYLSYNARIALDKMEKARAIAKRSGSFLRTDKVDFFKLANGSSCRVGGIYGTVTGYGYDLVIIDDPHKSRQEAESPTYRLKAYKNLTDTIDTRMEPHGSIIINMQRWRPDDLIGRAVDELGYRYIRLPALDNNNRPLWPERYGLEQLLKIKQVSSYRWESQYQGVPIPPGTQVFKNSYQYRKLPHKLSIAIGVDLAYSKNTASDFNVALAGGRLGNELYLLEMRRAQAGIDDFSAVIEHLAHKYRAPVYFRRGGTEKGVVQLLRRLRPDINIITLQAISDKLTRAQPPATAWNRGDILLPEPIDNEYPEPWIEELLNEVLNFTGVNDTHDDIVDALEALHSGLFPDYGTEDQDTELCDII